MQLRQAELLGVEDHHEGRLGHVDPDLDDGRCHEERGAPTGEVLHDLRLRKEGDVVGAGQSGTATHLRYLSVRRDEALIRAARKEAEALLNEDPTLGGQPELRRLLRAGSDGRLEWMQRS